MKIFISGTGGFVGQNLKNYFSCMGATVVAITSNQRSDTPSDSISMDELASMFRDLGKPQSTKSMKALFRVIDADSNGEVDFFEFQLYLWKSR